MARIPWAALSGEEVETVVSMLIFNEHPRASRIRPSRGDFGIDVATPHPGDEESADVYQVKKFATNLDASQRRQIEDSFQRVLVGFVRRGVPLADWYLVMPLDPTIENVMNWFVAMPDIVIERMASDEKLALTDEEIKTIRAWRQAPGRVIEWKGLTYCEVLASRHWFVPDYYLHGGSERIKSAVAEVAKILQCDLKLSDAESTEPSSSILEPAELREHLKRLARALDGDPHFRYGVSIDPIPPQLHHEPALLAAAQEIDPDGTCITFRIYERFAEAVNVRPIPIKIKFQFEAGSDEHQAFDEWRKYGKPLTANAAIDSDLPGGLGGSFDEATATITAADGGRAAETRYRIVGPDGTSLAELLFTVTSTTGLDGTGVYAEGMDVSGTVAIEGLLNKTDRSGKIEFSFTDPSGREATEVAPAVNFITSLAQPNRLQIAGKYGPFHDLHDVPEVEAPVPSFVARFITALASLQLHTATPVLVPDLAIVTGRHADRVLNVAKLLDGQTVIGTWKPFEFEVSDDASIDLSGHYQVATIEALVVEIGEQTLTFGTIQNTLLSARLTDLGGGRLRVEPHLNDTGHQTFAPGEPVPPAGRGPVRTRPVLDGESTEYSEAAE